MFLLDLLGLKLYFTFLILLLLLVYCYVTKDLNYWKIHGVPYIKPLPLLGNFKDLVLLKANLGSVLKDIYNKHKNYPFLGVFVMNRPYLVVNNPELIKNILVKDFNHFSDHIIIGNEIDDPVGTSLLFMLKNPKWKLLRQKVAPVFTSGKIRQMFPLMKDVGKELALYLFKSNYNQVDTRELCGKHATDIISSCAFGITSNSFRNENAEFRVMARRIFNWNDLNRAVAMLLHFLYPPLLKVFKLTFIEKRSAKFLTAAFWETMLARIDSKETRNDFMDLLIKVKNEELSSDDFKLDENMLVAQAVQFFMAGYETTTNTITFTLYALAMHQEIQNRARSEIRRVIEKHGSLTVEAIREMKYLEMVIKESLRKYPALPFLDRRCVQNYNIPGTEVVIEKGTGVLIPMLGLHYDPQYFEKPEVFDPDRFCEENSDALSSYVYFPFGEGPRSCIGTRFGNLSTKVALIHILNEFVIEPTDTTPTEVKFDPKGFTLNAVDKIYLKYRKLY